MLKLLDHHVTMDGETVSIQYSISTKRRLHQLHQFFLYAIVHNSTM